MENTNERYTKEVIKESVEIDRDNFDADTIATICTMICETLHKEGVQFTEVVEQLAKTYRKEFIMGEFGVCIAICDGIHDEPIVSLVTGSIPGVLKNLKFMTTGVKELMHDKDAD